MPLQNSRLLLRDSVAIVQKNTSITPRYVPPTAPATLQLSNTFQDYADNEDARTYDSRLRAPVDEGKELAVDHETGLKVYIASENAGIETSAGLVRRLFEKSIELGRKHHKDNNDKDAFFEALRLLGTGLHCLEGMHLRI